MAIGPPPGMLMFDRDKAEEELVAGTISEADEHELRSITSPQNWFNMLAIRDNAQRVAFLRDKSPRDVLLWLMRSGYTDPKTRAQCAIALLPYPSEGKDDIKPEGQP